MKIENLRYYSTADWASDEDITRMNEDELRNELQETRKLCNFLDVVFDNSHDGLCITDGNAIAMRVNRVWEYLSAVNREEIVGKDLISLEGSAISRSCSHMAIANKKTVTMEQKLLRTNRIIFVTCTPIFDDSGNIDIVISNNRDFSEMIELKEKVEQSDKMMREYQERLKLLISQGYNDGRMVAEDKHMLNILFTAIKVAPVNTSILIQGETGTGKEELAKFIYMNSTRKKKPFISIDCGAIAPNLIESEFFGYEKGAFTGASTTGKAGLFEIADGGTVFLDEIGELPLDLQVKLLRVLQEQEFKRVGGTTPIKIDIRIISATNRDLQTMVEEGKFRRDLYYRLNVVPISLPPLRERKTDIIPLAHTFLKEFNKKYDMSKEFAGSAHHTMFNYSWPGNIRELRNAVERAMVMSDNKQIEATDLPFASKDTLALEKLHDGMALEQAMDKIERKFVLDAYRECGSIRKAADKLGLSATTYARKLRKYNNGN